MTSLRVVRSRVTGFFSHRRRDRALDDEIQSHLDHLTDDFVNRGLSQDEAKAAARRALGRIEPVKEIYRDQRGLPVVEALLQDVRFALRLLSRQRAFTLAAAGTLAVGIGVNTTFFTIVNAICIRGLPIDRPQEVLSVRAVSPRGQQTGLSFADFEDATRSTTRFAGLAAYADSAMSVADEGRAADRVTGTYISAGAFRLLGRLPALGREFTEADDQPGAVAVVLLSDALWRSRYGADPSVLGRTMTV